MIALQPNWRYAPTSLKDIRYTPFRAVLLKKSSQRIGLITGQNHSILDQMGNNSRITSSPSIMLGKPVVRDTRITVETVLRKLAEGMSSEELLDSYPGLQKEDISACLQYSADVIGQEEIIAS